VVHTDRIGVRGSYRLLDCLKRRGLRVRDADKKAAPLPPPPETPAVEAPPDKGKGAKGKPEKDKGGKKDGKQR
jgi:hypothetical protein